jgi:hypothetical protein
MWEWLRELLERIAKAFAQWLERCIPSYDPASWNDADGIQYNNNCYNYACDIRTNTYAQPGAASGNMYSQINCVEVGDGAVSDGLVTVDCDHGCGCSKCHHQVALVIAPGPGFRDFHWYRKDRDGRWSHKPGGTPATNLDNSGNLILDPRTADRGLYTIFCGCYCVDKSAVTIT